MGKHGADILAPGALAKVASKSVKSAQKLASVFKNLQRAEGTLVLETAAGMGNGAEISLQRIKDATGRKDQIEKEDIAFHRKIREAFHHIGEQNPARFQIVDGSQSREAVFEEALKLIDVHCFAANT
ncbi:MAG: Thymidylate kinase [Chlamydiae bacterium]|nr:Thymidylate kinase [Chlamydiota bacterium]